MQVHLEINIYDGRHGTRGGWAAIGPVACLPSGDVDTPHSVLNDAEVDLGEADLSRNLRNSREDFVKRSGARLQNSTRITMSPNVLHHHRPSPFPTQSHHTVPPPHLSCIPVNTYDLPVFLYGEIEFSGP